jgi:hypothetical protein
MMGFGSRRPRCAALAAAAVTTALLALGGSASAAVNGERSNFSCASLLVTNTDTCLHVEAYGGRLTIGALTVPIVSVPITLDLAFNSQIEVGPLLGSSGEQTRPYALNEPANGRLVGGAAQNVPGGLLGILSGPISARQSQVTANAEFAGPEIPGAAIDPTGISAFFSTNYFIFEGGQGRPALKLPVRFHLHNPFLGPSCYIGSNADPVVLELITRSTNPPPPNRPLVGRPYKEGGFILKDGANVVEVQEGIGVDNSFSVPAASGCGISQTVLGHATGGLLDGAIDHKVGLPSPAGHNTVILDYNGELATQNYLE